MGMDVYIEPEFSEQKGKHQALFRIAVKERDQAIDEKIVDLGKGIGEYKKRLVVLDADKTSYYKEWLIKLREFLKDAIESVKNGGRVKISA